MYVQKPSRELSIGETLSWTFGIYSRNFILFFTPIFASLLITGILGGILALYVANLPQLPITVTPSEAWIWLITYIPVLMLAAFVIIILSWIVSTIANGICVKCASDVIEKGSANLENAFNSAARRLLSLLAVAIISGILIILGLIALIIPGIILAIMFSLVVPAIIIENVGALESLSRSRRLVSNRWVKTFLFILVIVIIIAIASAIASWIVSPIWIFGEPTSSIVGSILTAIMTAFITPILPISMTVYYYSMLAKEQLSLPPPPPPQ